MAGMEVTCDTMGSARHRRRSSWRLWGSHILLLYILHICSLSHCECNYMCNQLWSNYTYLINLLFSYIPLFFIIFIIFIIIIIILILLQKVVHICLWHCFIVVRCVFISFIQYYCIVLFHSFGVSQAIWFVILHFGMQHTKFWGACVTRWYCGWYLGHLESPITPVTHLVLMWIFHIFILLNLKLKFFNLFIHFYCFSGRIPCIGLWYFCCIYMDYHCTGVGTLI